MGDYKNVQYNSGFLREKEGNEREIENFERY